MPLSDDERELLESANRAKELLEHSGWKAFAWAVERQIAVHMQLALTKMKTADDALDRQEKIGTINGLRLALESPAATVAAADEVRARLAQEDEDEME